MAESLRDLYQIILNPKLYRPKQSHTKFKDIFKDAKKFRDREKQIYEDTLIWNEKIKNLPKILDNIICPHCLKSVIVNELNITCPFCDKIYREVVGQNWTGA